MSEDEIKRQIGSLVSRAREALAEVREAVVRSSQVGKMKIDVTFLRREQDKAYQRLGAKVFELAEEGEIELSKELTPLVDLVRSLGRQIVEQEAELSDVEDDPARGEDDPEPT